MSVSEWRKRFHSDLEEGEIVCLRNVSPRLPGASRFTSPHLSRQSGPESPHELGSAEPTRPATCIPSRVCSHAASPFVAGPAASRSPTLTPTNVGARPPSPLAPGEIIEGDGGGGGGGGGGRVAAAPRATPSEPPSQPAWLRLDEPRGPGATLRRRVDELAGVAASGERRFGWGAGLARTSLPRRLPAHAAPELAEPPDGGAFRSRSQRVEGAMSWAAWGGAAATAAALAASVPLGWGGLAAAGLAASSLAAAMPLGGGENEESEEESDDAADVGDDAATNTEAAAELAHAACFGGRNGEEWSNVVKGVGGLDKCLDEIRQRIWVSAVGGCPGGWWEGGRLVVEIGACWW